MHPAFSVIFFTVASGAGFGLMAVAAGLSGLGGTRLDTRFVLAIGVLALLLAGFGLLSSLLHLGRPERAWRAVSQWRSSWLSREGVLALLTMPVATDVEHVLSLLRRGHVAAAQSPIGSSRVLGPPWQGSESG